MGRVGLFVVLAIILFVTASYLANACGGLLDPCCGNGVLDSGETCDVGHACPDGADCVDCVCQMCVPDCSGGCGSSDGCGNTCMNCPAGEVCESHDFGFSYACYCDPMCGAKGCGPGACSGSVCGPMSGYCPSGKTCNLATGMCVTCLNGNTTSCYTGPAGTQDVGVCHAGVKPLS